MYRSPRVPLHNLLSNLDEILFNIHLSPHCIIAGDFNVDSISCETILKYFASKDFYSAISGVSTNYGSQLDYAFYRCLSPKVHFYESYFSDHKAMLIDLSYSKINLVDNLIDNIFSSSNDATIITVFLYMKLIYMSLLIK